MSAVLLVGAGCEDPAPKAAGGGKGTAAATASPSATPSAGAVMPSVVGKPFTEAEAAVKGLVTPPVKARSAYADVTLAPDHGAWAVCFQTPAAGAAVQAASVVELSLVAAGTPCPGQAGATLKPSTAPTPPAPPATPTPKPVPKPKATVPTDAGSTGGDGGNGETASSSSGGGGADVYYSNCTAAKAAGAAPIRRGQPGYRSALDRDNDGIACDK
ncbi:excalibur calcium-binding domain-containing protein [Streptomyces sp. NBC_00536]|nr:excalibur calcium-binding domain-containing protein [Streptomyces sp. NBC_00536]